MNATYYVLSGGVYYEQYGDRLYLRNVDTRREYFFNETVRDALDCFKTHDRLCVKELCDALLEIYDPDDTEEFFDDMSHLVDELAGEGILHKLTMQEENRMGLFESLQQQCMKGHILLSLSLELSYRCNEHCVHCYIDEKTDDQSELGFNDYRKILDEARAMGCLYLLLTGGEVTMKDCFADIAEYASSLGMLVDIYSNGLDVSPELFDRICSIKPNSFSFSLYGGTAEVHDAITGVKGSFERTLHSILMTKCAGIDTYIKTVIMRETVSDLEGLIRLGSRIGVEICPSYTILDSRSGNSRALHRLSSLEEYKAAMRIFDSGASCYSDNIRDIDSPVCAAGQCSLAVNPYGIVTPCLTMNLPLGNLRTESLREIWEHSPQLERIRSLRFRDVCPDYKICTAVEHCDICLGRLDLQTIRIPQDVCVLAQATQTIKEEKRK